MGTLGQFEADEIPDGREVEGRLVIADVGDFSVRSLPQAGPVQAPDDLLRLTTPNTQQPQHRITRLAIVTQPFVQPAGLLQAFDQTDPMQQGTIGLHLSVHSSHREIRPAAERMLNKRQVERYTVRIFWPNYWNTTPADGRPHLFHFLGLTGASASNPGELMAALGLGLLSAPDVREYREVVVVAPDPQHTALTVRRFWLP